jgi:hypothetical protein
MEGHCLKGLTGCSGGGYAKTTGLEEMVYIQFEATVVQKKNIKVDDRY